MAKVIIMPKLGFTQEEGSLMGWHKKVGDTVRKGEPFFDAVSYTHLTLPTT